MINVNEPLLNGKEKEYLLNCIETGWISSEGPYVKEFEEKFAAYIGRQHGVAVANGSAALEVAVKVLGIGNGDEVIMPAFTIISPAAAVTKEGGIPVLVDCDRYTWNMKVEEIEKKITPKTKAIVIVHIYGIPTDIDPVLALAKKHGLKVIEDAAEMHGQTYKGTKCGCFGDISIFSFYPNKHITTGEGGMIMTNDVELADKCRYYRNLCFKPGRRFVHEHIGWNYRMTNIQAALGLAQLERIDEFITIKRKIGKKYQELLSDIDAFELPVIETDYATNIYWIFGIVLKEGFKYDAQQMMTELGKLGVGTRPFFWPIHLQPVYNNQGMYLNEKYPNSEFIADRGFYIPSGLGLKESELTEVADILHKVVLL